MEVQTTPPVKNREPLNETEKNFLRENYLYLTDEAIAEILGLSNAVTARKIRSNLNLLRNKKRLNTFVREVPMVIWLQRELYDNPNFTELIRINN